MDRDPNPSSSDARATLRDLLLRRLAQTLREMRTEGIAGPAAFEELVRRNPTPTARTN